MSFTPLGDALRHNVTGATPIKKQIQAALLVEAAEAVFQELFGAEKPQAKALFLKNRTLTVSCASGAVAQEIRLRQAEIVAKINAKIGAKEVDRIRYLA